MTKAGATPKLTRSERESNSTPKLEFAFKNLAIFPSILSKKEAKTINETDGDTNVPIIVTQTQISVPEGNNTAIQIQTVADPRTCLDSLDSLDFCLLLLV